MIPKEEIKIGIILLAAGEASRMGMPKQLLVYRRKPLIRHMLQEIQALALPTVVVLGARALLIGPVIADLPVKVVVNENWQRGMGSSLKLGLQYLQAKESQLKGVLCCVVDQPFLTQALLRQFVEKFNTLEKADEKIIAAAYASGVMGVPALLGTQLFPAVYALSDAVGARRLIQQADQLISIPFPQGDFDLDRQEEWDQFRKVR